MPISRRVALVSFAVPLLARAQPVEQPLILYGFPAAIGPLVPASVSDLKGFLAWAKANPEQANSGSPGAGSTPHFIGALLGLANDERWGPRVRRIGFTADS